MRRKGLNAAGELRPSRRLHGRPIAGMRLVLVAFAVVPGASTSDAHSVARVAVGLSPLASIRGSREASWERSKEVDSFHCRLGSGRSLEDCAISRAVYADPEVGFLRPLFMLIWSISYEAT